MVVVPGAVVGAGPVILTVLVAPVIISLLVSGLWIYGKKKGDSKLPPGDMGWPIVGSTFSLFRPHLATTLSDFLHLHLSRYGKIFSTRYRGKTIVISADPEFNRFVLKNEMRLFQNDLPSHFLTVLGKNHLPFLTGETYRRTKTSIHHFISNYQIETHFLAEAEKAAERVLTQWRHKSLVLAYEETNKFVFSLAVRMAMGMTLDDPEVEELRRAFIAVNRGLFAVPLNLPFTHYSKALKYRGIIQSTIKRIVEDRKLNDNKMEDKKNDLIWWFLKDDPSMSMQSICDGVFGIIFAALFTTQKTIALAMHFLQQYPKSLQQIRDEFKQKEKDGDGTAKLTWIDYKNMEFCQSVINETLRFSNATFGLWRKALSDINFKGYTIPQGTTVLTHFAAVHLDPTVFENPNTFDPWRWLSKERSNNFMSFGGGARQCDGSEIARTVISVFLRRLILNHDWEPVEPDQPIALPLITFPKGYPIRLLPLKEKSP